MPVGTEPVEVIHAWTDGSVRPKNPGYGGSAYLIIGEKVWLGSKWMGANKTNNQAELQAILDALVRLNELISGGEIAKPVVLHSDSEWAVNSITGVYASRANREYLDKIAEAWKSLPQVTFKWCRGHAGDPYNEFVDKMARVTTLIPQHCIAQTFTREQFSTEARKFLADQELLVRVN